MGMLLIFEKVAIFENEEWLIPEPDPGSDPSHPLLSKCVCTGVRTGG